jgi:lipoate-protein ligase A
MMNDELSASATTGCTDHSSFIIHHSSFCLLLDPPAAGAWNMAVDEALLEAAAADGQCTLRFYRWAEPTLSLGYFQPYADRWQHAASGHCPAVRRTSGGGAILHDAELTYSFAVPNGHPLAADRLRFYQAVHAALIEVLAEWGIEATMLLAGQNETFSRRRHGDGSATSTQPQADVPSAAKRRSFDRGQYMFAPPVRQPFLCFQRRSPGDVLVSGIKVAGSAQRRCRGAVLQHGSVLLARSAAAPELPGIGDLAGRPIRPEEAIEAWLRRLAGALGLAWQSGTLSDAQRRRAAKLATDKYARPAWTENRGHG